MNSICFIKDNTAAGAVFADGGRKTPVSRMLLVFPIQTSEPKKCIPGAFTSSEVQVVSCVCDISWKALWTRLRERLVKYMIKYIAKLNATLLCYVSILTLAPNDTGTDTC